jgi:outer membrane protein assembly factor BamA
MKTAILLLAVTTLGLAAETTRPAPDDVLLLEDARRRLAYGKTGTAELALETLIAVYPESSLVPQAREELRRIHEQQEQARASAPVVRSVVYERVRRVSAQQITERLRQREVRLEVEAPYDLQDVEEARKVVEDFLHEKGIPSARVVADVRPVPPHSVEVRFIVVPRPRSASVILP